MAEGKRTFVFYSDWVNMIREMPDNDAGQLLKHILSYVNDEDPTTDNLLVKMAFAHMKPILKSDLEKWESIREKRKTYGRKGGQAKSNKTKQTEAKANQKQAKAKQVEAVNDNVNVNVNVNVNDNENKESKNSFSPDVEQVFESVQDLFDDKYLKTEKQIFDAKDTIRKLIEIDKQSPEDVQVVIKWARTNEFWKSNFLTIPKLRKVNRDGIKYFDVFVAHGRRDVSSNNSKQNYFDKIIHGEI